MRIFGKLGLPIDQMISFRDVIAGVLIGAANQSWFEVFISSIGWAFVGWLYVTIIAGKAGYKPGTRLFFGSPALSRFIVWWTTAFVTSLIVGAGTFGIGSGHDGQGACLFTKRLERGRFLWPSVAGDAGGDLLGSLGYLPSGIDWRNLQEPWRPTSVG
jgi:hypothetical protein